MPTLIENLNLINSYKSDIKSAIENKGVDMTGVSFGSYADKIGEIETGGGGISEYDITIRSYGIVDLSNSASFVGSYAFYYDRSLQTVNLPDCERVLYMAFRGCPSLSQVNLPKCTYISNGAFQDCPVTQMSLPVCSLVESYAFMSTTLTEIDLPNCTSIGAQAFYSCSLLSKVSIPMLRGGTMSSTFYQCYSLSELTIGFECYTVPGYYYTLVGTQLASGVGSIYVPAPMYSKYVVAYGWSGFADRFVSVGDPDDYLLSYSDGLLYGKTAYISLDYLSALGINKNSVVSVSLTKCRDFEVTTYYNSTPFQSCTNLERVDLPSCSIVLVNMFQYCSKLAYVSIPECVSILERGFQFCSSLTSVDFPLCEYVGLYAFNGCSRMTNVSFPVCSYIGSNAFYNCYSLMSVDFPLCEYVGSYAFYNCSSLTSADFALCEYVGSFAFSSCVRMTNVSFPVCSYLGIYAFCNCSSLTSVDFPLCEYVGAYAFNGCSRMTNVSFPVCSYIGEYAFRFCSLSYVNLPLCGYISISAFYSNKLNRVDLGNCSFIDNYAFASNPLVTIIVRYSDGVCSLGGTGTFYSTNLSTGYIYVPESLVEDYKVAQYWSSLSERIFMIMDDLMYSDGLVFGWASTMGPDYLDELSISAADVTGVSMSMLFTLSSSTFMNHVNLVDVNIPYVSEYPDDTFNGCSSLSEFNIEVSVLGDRVFANCSGLETVTIGYDGIVTAGSDLFLNCQNLSQIYVPYGWISSYESADGWSQYSSIFVENIPDLLFSDGLVFGGTKTIDSTYLASLGITSNQVVSVSLPNCTSIGYRTFNEHHSLKDLSLPEVTYIESFGFFGANYINDMVLPKCSYIGNQAFSWTGMGSFKNLTLGYSGVCTNDNAYFSNNIQNIYVPASLVDSYKVAPYWSAFSSKIRPIPE